MNKNKILGNYTTRKNSNCTLYRVKYLKFCKTMDIFFMIVLGNLN